MSQTINQAIQLRVGAEDIATLGYQPNPQLVLGELGGFALMNKDGKNKTTVHFSDTIRTAWQQLLQTLTDRDIPIPDILRSPRFTPVSQDLSAGIFLFPDRIEVSAWGVDLGSLSFVSTGFGPYYALLPSKKVTNIYENNMVLIGHEYNYQTVANGVDCPDKSIANGNNNERVYIKDSAITSASQASQSLQGQYLLYQLAEPITIPLDTPLDSHLTLHNASDYDVWIPLSEDGVEMYEYIPDFEGTGTHVYHWNREWVRSVGHQPVALEILDHGWTDRLNAAFLRNLRADYTQLRKDFDDYKQSHP